MPSFSLVRRFGKQRKTIIHSPVSSGLIEQHVGHTMLESSHSQIRQPSEAGNVFSSTRTANSHGLTSGLVALSQHMEGVSIRNIKGNVMSNNHVNINHYYYSSQANFNDMLRVGDIRLEEEIESYLDANNVWRARYKGQIMVSSTSNMSIWSYCGERAEEVESLSHLTALANSSRHLKGLTKNIHHCLALVFHGAPYLVPQSKYYVSLPSSQWMTHYVKLCSINNISLHIACCGLMTCEEAFETNTFIKKDLLDYYKFLFDMVYWSFNHRTSTLDNTAPFQLSHPEIHLPVYSLPGWNKFVFLMNGMDTTVQKTGIVLTLLPNMIMRTQSYDIIFNLGLPGKLLHPGSSYQHRGSTDHCHARSIENWKKGRESPVPNDLLEVKHLYLFCPQNSAGKIYWLRDEDGQHVIEDSLIQASFGITVDRDWDWDTYVYPIPPQFYEILGTIHEACGFDPYSTEVAEYLGLSLAVIDNGYLGLEEYVEDPEYTSESESGDSDYVLASEDVLAN
ncbi:hypothetical protein C8J56DRAFT_890532 [Mycena floridula]|nr:hypothetical protein C8J56DRAFT_890532 [Mycena floridula]